jgi:4-aminobutyrate aminotransferase-like enzyme
VRIAPPMTVTADQVEDALGILGEAFQRMYKVHPELAQVR